MTGWGQEGPLADSVGHDTNYIALSGVLASIGDPGRLPPIPLNLIGDLGGGGIYLAMGMLAALLETSRSGQGQVVDAAMIDGGSDAPIADPPAASDPCILCFTSGTSAA